MDRGFMLPARSLLAAVLVLAAAAPRAPAFSLRAPQVAFDSAVLHGDLNAWDGGINPNTDQINAATIAPSGWWNRSFSVLLEANPTTGTSIGLYNGSAGATPTLYTLFTTAAKAGYSVWCRVDVAGVLTVSLFDNTNTFLGMVSYPGANGESLGFYIQSPAGIKYSQDARNGGLPQVLTYAGTGVNMGDYFECFEPYTYDPTRAGAFAGAILQLIPPLPPLPVRHGTWGALKSAYR